MPSRNETLNRSLLLFFLFLVVIGACKDSNQGRSKASTRDATPPDTESRYSFHVQLLRSNHAFDVSTEGAGSLRAMTIVHTENGIADTVKEEIDGSVVNAACADLDRDSIPEVYVFAQSAGSGSYANLYGFQFDQRGRQSIVLPELDKRLAAGYLGHDTLWVRDTVLVRMFPVYTEGDINASASGGTRTIEYTLQRDRDGELRLFAVRVINNRDLNVQH